MAKAIATCTCETCGKTFEVTSYKRNLKERYSWEEWAAEHYIKCPECQEREAEERATKLAKKAAAEGLPALIGTPKQRAWAEEIRTAFLAEMDKISEEAHNKIELRKAENKPTVKAEEGLEIFDKTLAYIIETKKYASFWIDNRDNYSYRFKCVWHTEKSEIEAWWLKRIKQQST